MPVSVKQYGAFVPQSALVPHWTQSWVVVSQ
jgi:hypothetical protein